MAFRIDLFGDDAPTESKPIDGRVTYLGTAIEVTKSTAMLYVEEHGCAAGQADLIEYENIIGSWVWQGRDFHFESNIKGNLIIDAIVRDTNS